MNPTKINEYLSRRGFHLHEAGQSGTLVIRANKSPDPKAVESSDFIDLVFMTTDYVELPYRLAGLRVSQPCDKLAVLCEQNFSPRRSGEIPTGKRVFAIESDGKRFHIIAAKLWILVSKQSNNGALLDALLSGDPSFRDNFISRFLKQWYVMGALYEDSPGR